jgi:hypothetical protein
MTDLLSSFGAMRSISSMIGISFDLAAASNAPLTGAATLITTRRLVPDCPRRVVAVAAGPSPQIKPRQSVRVGWVAHESGRGFKVLADAVGSISPATIR